MDSIYISDLRVQTCIGITNEEKATPQEVRISIEMFTDTSKAGESDDIEDTIDYEEVANHIKKAAEVTRNTVESFAEDIAKIVLERFKPNSVRVAVWKFILQDTSGTAVTITRP